MKIIHIILFVLIFLPGFALAGTLDIEFESAPLFSEANFLPGRSVLRWINVLNNSGQEQGIAVDAINMDNSSRLGDALNLEINKGGELLYSAFLSDFFDAGEVFLSNIENGEEIQYDFQITFLPESGNSYQGKSIGFDFRIGSQTSSGENDGDGETYGSAGGGSGGGGTYQPQENNVPPEVKGFYTEKETPEISPIVEKAKEIVPGRFATDDSSPGDEEENLSLPVLVASMGDVVGSKYLRQILIILIIMLIALFFYSIKKGKIEKNKIWWTLPFLIIILLIVYYFYYPYAKIIIPAVILISLIAYIGVMKNAKGF